MKRTKPQQGEESSFADFLNKIRHHQYNDFYDLNYLLIHIKPYVSNENGSQEDPVYKDQLKLALSNNYEESDLVMNLIHYDPKYLNHLSSFHPWVLELLKDNQMSAGITALHLACLYHREEAIAILLKHGFSKDIRDIKGRTPEDYYSSEIGYNIENSEIDAAIHPEPLIQKFLGPYNEDTNTVVASTSWSQSKFSFQRAKEKSVVNLWVDETEICAKKNSRALDSGELRLCFSFRLEKNESSSQPIKNVTLAQVDETYICQINDNGTEREPEPHLQFQLKQLARDKLTYDRYKGFLISGNQEEMKVLLEKICDLIDLGDPKLGKDIRNKILTSLDSDLGNKMEMSR